MIILPCEYFKNSFNIVHSPSSVMEDLMIVCDQMGVICSKNFHLKRESFNNYLFFYVESGTFHLKQYGEHYIFTSGQFVLISLHDAHEYYSDTDDICNLVWFHFRGYAIENIMTTLKNNNFLPVVSKDCEILTSLTNLFDLAGKHTSKYELEFAQIIFKIVSLMTKNSISNFVNKDSNFKTWFCSNVLSYIENHVNEKINLEDLSKSVDFSLSYFLKIFPQYFDVPPHKLIINIKLQNSIKLLLYSDKSICEISNILNFTDQSHYGKMFKKIYGTSPANYRKMFQI